MTGISIALSSKQSMHALRRRLGNSSELKIEDADVKDDVKMAWHIHTWEYHAANIRK